MRELLDADGKRDGVEARPSILTGDQDAQQARGRRRVDGFVWEAIFEVDLRRVRPSHSLRQLAHGRTEGRVLGRQVQVH